MSKGLSKSKIMYWVQCPKRLYLSVHNPDLAEPFSGPSIGWGVDLGETARTLWTDGILIEHVDNPRQALLETRQALESDDPKNVMFEAAFSHDGVLVRGDVFMQQSGKNQLVEVKGSTSVHQHYLTDSAIQAWVIENSGFPLDQVFIGHVNNQFVYPGGGNYQGLLHLEDVTENVQALKNKVTDWVGSCRQTLDGTDPNVSVGSQCHDPYECPFLAHCTPENNNQAKYPVHILPWGNKLADELITEGFVDIREVPEERLSKPLYKRIQRASITGKAEVAPEIKTIIKGLAYPRLFIDFETIQFSVPIWEGTRPYEQLPFQWSCHIEEKNGQLHHKSFLDISGDIPLRSFAESLLEAVGDSGPVLVWSGFEAGKLRALQVRFPDLAGPLEKLIARIVDLLPLAREHYYHPDMMGSWSIKAVLPTVAPDLNYGDLGEVQDGMAAGTAFLEAIDPKTSTERRASLFKDMEEYCKLDTLAMVKVANFFG